MMMEQEPRRVNSRDLKAPGADRICALCLTAAGALRDLSDYTTIVGGIVPSLLIDQASDETGFLAHAGTRDLDLGINLGIENPEILRPIGDRLRDGGFVPFPRDDGAVSRTKWCFGENTGIWIDLLVQATPEVAHQEVAAIGDGVAASAFEGLEFAFLKRTPVLMAGTNLAGERTTARMYYCGPAAYVVLKTQAFLSRRNDKDIYDLIYLLHYWPGGPEEIAGMLREWRDMAPVRRVLDQLRKLFADIDSDGPQCYAGFKDNGARYGLGDNAIDRYGAEAHSTVWRLLRAMG